MPEEEVQPTPDAQPEAAVEEAPVAEETVSEDAAPSEAPETVVVDQQMLDENPELADAGVVVGDVGDVITDEEAQARIDRENYLLEHPEEVTAGDPIPSDGQPV